MADNAALDSFLAAGTPPEAAQAPPSPAAPSAPESTQAPSSAPTEPAAKVSEATPEPEDDIAPHTGSDNRTVPFSALEKVRNDWKSKYAAEQARAELLAKQLEEAKRPPPPPQAPQQQYIPPPPDPRVDPAGWAQDFAVRAQHAMLNERLNTSETMLRDKLGDAKVDEYVGAFKQAAEKDPQLFGKLYSQPAPYQWLVREMDRQRAHADIGDDPAAYRSKLEAELRAKWEAEQGEQANGNGGARVSPAAGLPPSLANARSVAGRSQSTFTGPPSMEELFPGHNKRRR